MGSFRAREKRKWGIVWKKSSLGDMSLMWLSAVNKPSANGKKQIQHPWREEGELGYKCNILTEHEENLAYVSIVELTLLKWWFGA